MSDLAAFLRARLDEDEAAGRATFPQWPKVPPSLGDWEDLNLELLRWVEAARAILAIYEEQDGYDLPAGVHDGRDPDQRVTDEAVWDELDNVVRFLAGVYRDHPDYRQEWKP